MVKGSKEKMPAPLNSILSSKLDWINVDAWKCFCHWWTSDKYKEKRKRGQDARFANEDYAQQQGGSLPFCTIQQNLVNK